MAFDDNFNPEGIERARIERIETPMDASDDADMEKRLLAHLYDESQRILAQVRTSIGVASGIDSASSRMEQLVEAQDGLIHAIIDVHTLIHLEMGRATD